MFDIFRVILRKRSVWLCALTMVLGMVVYVHITRATKKQLVSFDNIQAILQEQLCPGCKYNRLNEKRIPKIIHQIWNEDVVPAEFVENIKSFINYNRYPEWEYYFWTLDLGREFIRHKFPGILKIYDCSDMFTKPDILRILVIYHYGGVYFDLDVLNIRPLDRFVDGHECVLSGALPEYFVAYDFVVDYHRVNNAILLCRPNHPFYGYLVSHTEERSGKIQKGDSCPRPEFPYPLLKFLTKNGLNESLPEIVDYSFFEPMYDLTVTSLMQKKCSGTQYQSLEPAKRRICDEWRRLGEHKRLIFENSYTVHTWYHTGINKVTRDPKNKISKIVPHVKMYNTWLKEHAGAV